MKPVLDKNGTTFLSKISRNVSLHLPDTYGLFLRAERMLHSAKDGRSQLLSVKFKIFISRVLNFKHFTYFLLL